MLKVLYLVVCAIFCLQADRALASSPASVGGGLPYSRVVGSLSPEVIAHAKADFATQNPQFTSITVNPFSGKVAAASAPPGRKPVNENQAKALATDFVTNNAKAIGIDLKTLNLASPQAKILREDEGNQQSPSFTLVTIQGKQPLVYPGAADLDSLTYDLSVALLIRDGRVESFKVAGPLLPPFLPLNTIPKIPSTDKKIMSQLLPQNLCYEDIEPPQSKLCFQMADVEYYAPPPTLILTDSALPIKPGKIANRKIELAWHFEPSFLGEFLAERAGSPYAWDFSAEDGHLIQSFPLVRPSDGLFHCHEVVKGVYEIRTPDNRTLGAPAQSRAWNLTEQSCKEMIGGTRNKVMCGVTEEGFQVTGLNLDDHDGYYSYDNDKGVEVWWSNPRAWYGLGFSFGSDVSYDEAHKECLFMAAGSISNFACALNRVYDQNSYSVYDSRDGSYNTLQDSSAESCVKELNQ